MVWSKGIHELSTFTNEMENETFTNHEISMGQAVLEFIKEKQELGASSEDLLVSSSSSIIYLLLIFI